MCSPSTTYRKKQAPSRKIRYKHAYQACCILCDNRLKSISTDTRNLTTLSEKVSLSIHVSRCTNPACPHHLTRLKPAAYLNQIVPESGYGIDVYGLIGHLRLLRRLTIPEIHAHLCEHYPHIEMGERHVENIWNHLRLCIEERSKDAHYLASLYSDCKESGLVLSIDGVEPEKGHAILYIIREIGKGRILYAHYSTYTDAESIKKEILSPFSALLTKAGLKVSGWVADKELALSKAIQSTFPDAVFQHCQSHFLAAMKSPLRQEDTQLGKEVKKTLVRSGA